MPLPGSWHDSCSTAHSLFHANHIYRDMSCASLPEPRSRALSPTARRSPDDATSTAPMKNSPGSRGAMPTPTGGLRVVGTHSHRAPVHAGWLRPVAGRAPGQPSRGSMWRRLALAFAGHHPGHLRGLAKPRRTYSGWPPRMSSPLTGRGTGSLAYSLVYGSQRHSWTVPRGGWVSSCSLARLVTARGSVIHRGAQVTSLLRDGCRCAHAGPPQSFP